MKRSSWGIPPVSLCKPCPNPKTSVTVPKQTHSSARTRTLPWLGSFFMEWAGDGIQQVLDFKNKQNQLLHFPVSAGNAPNDTFDLAVM